MFNDITLWVDMDGTLAEWRCDATYEDLYEEGYFASLSPHKELIAALKSLAEEGLKIRVLSCYLKDSPYALKEKEEWVKRYCPFLSDSVFVPNGEDKSLWIGHQISKKDILLDDYSRNLFSWQSAGGTAIKALNGVNHTKGSWMGRTVILQQRSESISNILEKAVPLF